MQRFLTPLLEFEEDLLEITYQTVRIQRNSGGGDPYIALEGITPSRRRFTGRGSFICAPGLRLRFDLRLKGAG